MEQERQTLCRRLADANASLGFLLILIAAILLSFYAASLERRRLCLALAGEEARAAALPDVLPLRWRGSAMVVEALGFFLCLALKNCRQAAAGTDAAARRSAEANLWAAVLVLSAALVRLEDLRALLVRSADG